MVISDIFHLRSVGGDQQHSHSLKVFICVCSSRPAFPTGPSVCWGGGGGGGGGGGEVTSGQQASSLSSKHKLWNFHRSC